MFIFEVVVNLYLTCFSDSYIVSFLNQVVKHILENFQLSSDAILNNFEHLIN